MAFCWTNSRSTTSADSKGSLKRQIIMATFFTSMLKSISFKALLWVKKSSTFFAIPKKRIGIKRIGTLLKTAMITNPLSRTNIKLHFLLA